MMEENKNNKDVTVFTQKGTVNIVEEIQSKAFNPRNLRRQERMQVVAFLRDEGKSGYEIARFLGFCDKTIWNDIRDIKRNAAHLVSEISIDRVAGDLIREAGILINKAKVAKDYKLCWQIKCELIDKLQSMGYVLKIAEKLNVSGKVETGETRINVYNNFTDPELRGIVDLAKRINSTSS